ncbi:MAG: biopolymer transporter ExbD [Prevotella sp.]|nr:biopolymer transporter ExbD [Prevotella sp.]
MFRRRRFEQVPELNTSSTADISFMLLIFFLVASSMDTDKGLLRQLPPPPQEQQPPTDVSKDHILQVTLDASDQLAVDGTLITPQQLRDQIAEFVAADRTDHVISIRTDRATTYEAYFRMQNAIVAAYSQLRERYARERFGKGYGELEAEQRDEINQYYPQRISESKPSEGGAS